MEQQSENKGNRVVAEWWDWLKKTCFLAGAAWISIYMAACAGYRIPILPAHEVAQALFEIDSACGVIR